jgi:hypothetical protein
MRLTAFCPNVVRRYGVFLCTNVERIAGLHSNARDEVRGVTTPWNGPTRIAGN